MDQCLIVIVSFLLKESGVLIDWRQVFQVVRIGQFQLVKEIVEVLVIGEVENLIEMRLLVMSNQFPYLYWLFFTFFHLGRNQKCNLLNGCVVWDARRVLEFVSYYFTTFNFSKITHFFWVPILDSVCVLMFSCVFLSCFSSLLPSTFLVFVWSLFKVCFLILICFFDVLWNNVFLKNQKNNFSGRDVEKC